MPERVKASRSGDTANLTELFRLIRTGRGDSPRAEHLRLAAMTYDLGAEQSAPCGGSVSPQVSAVIRAVLPSVNPREGLLGSALPKVPGQFLGESPVPQLPKRALRHQRS